VSSAWRASVALSDTSPGVQGRAACLPESSGLPEAIAIYARSELNVTGNGCSDDKVPTQIPKVSAKGNSIATV
jgi:hypothetical protein